MARPTGFLKSDRDLRDYKIDKEKVCMSSRLPESFSVEHSPIKDQGCVNSCVAHSVAEALEAAVPGDVAYSTAWIYGYRPKSYYQGIGMYYKDALTTAMKNGFLTQDDLPGNVEVPLAQKQVNAKVNIYLKYAAKRKICGYARLCSPIEIKQALYALNYPVLIAIMMGDDIVLDEDNVAIIPEELNGGHAMVCYGWNEKGFMVQNSWSEQWGDKGCFILPYEYPIVESWSIQVDLDENEFIAKKPSYYPIRRFIQKIVNFFKHK